MKAVSAFRFNEMLVVWTKTCQGIFVSPYYTNITPRLDDLGFETRQGLGIFQFTTVSRPALEPTLPPIQWVPGVLSLEVKRPGRETDHSPPSSAEVNNVWRYNSTPQYAFMAWCSVKAQRQLYLTLYEVQIDHRQFSQKLLMA